IIGLGGVGQRHVRNLRALLGNDVELLAYRVRRLSHIVTPTLDVDRIRDVETEYDIHVFARLEEALARRPAVAFICNPTSLHVQTALMCARAGCDLFIEKPISNDFAGVPELLQDVQRLGRIVMVGYQLRFHPCFVALQRLLREGDIGSPFSVRAVVGEYLPGWHRYQHYRSMYAARP